MPRLREPSAAEPGATTPGPAATTTAPSGPAVTIATSRFDAAVFDLDGVITDTARVHAAAWRQLFDRFGESWASRDGQRWEPFSDVDYARHVDGRSRYDGVAAFLASRGIELAHGDPDDPPGRETVCGLGNAKDELFRAALEADGVEVFTGTIDLVERLRDAGVAVAVASASRNAAAVLDAAGAAGLFAARVDGVDADEQRLAGKPDPALFLEATRRLGCSPRRSVLFEDALAGVEAGRRGGFGLVIGVDRNGSGEALLGAGADVVVRDLAEVVVDRDGQPTVGGETGWTIELEGDGLASRVHAALLAVSSGVLGVRGELEDDPAAQRYVAVAGAFGVAPDGVVRPLPGPAWTALGPSPTLTPTRRRLDLRTGVLVREPSEGDALRTERFASVSRPGLLALRAEAPAGSIEFPSDPLSPPAVDRSYTAEYRLDHGRDADGTWVRTTSDRAVVTAVARQRTWGEGGISRLERLAVVQAGGDADRDSARAQLDAATGVGFDSLLDEHRREWSTRWAAADIEIDGDAAAQLAVRFALFHLLSCAPTEGEAVVGARGLTGHAYAGHVFWDTDVFVLPALAAVLPALARAVLEYRIRRLPAARARAIELGRPGVRFPWESADLGEEVTPPWVTDVEGHLVPVRTGQREEHINADVAWAALHYAEWTGDTGLVEGPGRDLLVETARYWTGRIRTDADGGHLFGVIGPDEYHEVVDDNTFTNEMVRWHLRQAGAVLAAAGEHDGAALFAAHADSIVSGYDPATGRHEQFAGFWDLQPLIISGVTTTPVAADILLGRDRVRHTQVIKQPDVLMLHHLLPDCCPEGSLANDLDFYLPRLAHGSSLSPAICASLLARARRPDEALELFDVAARLDLDDLTGTTAAGLHLATLGGLWQAVVFGFAGVRPGPDALVVDPCLPERWRSLRVRVTYRGTPVTISIDHDEVLVVATGPVPVVLLGERVTTPARQALSVREGSER